MLASLAKCFLPFLLVMLIIKFTDQKLTEYSNTLENENPHSLANLHFPSIYHATGIIRIPSAGIAEPFEAWYAGKYNKSRIDYYGGTVSTYQRADIGKYGTLFEVFPKYDYRHDNHYKGCWKKKGKEKRKIEPQGVLPKNVYWPFKMSIDQYKYAGKEMVNGTLCKKWIANITVLNRTDTYIFHATDEDKPKPKKLEMQGYDVLLVSYYDHYIIDYTSFQEWMYNETKFNTQIVAKRDRWCQFVPKSAGEAGYRSLNPMGELLDDDSYRDFEMKFQKYKKTFNKIYGDEGEYRRKMQIARHNMRYIHSKNRQCLGFKLDVNHFTDLTDDEYNSHRGMSYDSREESDDFETTIPEFNGEEEESVVDHHIKQQDEKFRNGKDDYSSKIITGNVLSTNDDNTASKSHRNFLRTKNRGTSDIMQPENTFLREKSSPHYNTENKLKSHRLSQINNLGYVTTSEETESNIPGSGDNNFKESSHLFRQQQMEQEHTPKSSRFALNMAKNVSSDKSSFLTQDNQRTKLHYKLNDAILKDIEPSIQRKSFDNDFDESERLKSVKRNENVEEIGNGESFWSQTFELDDPSFINEAENDENVSKINSVNESNELYIPKLKNMEERTVYSDITSSGDENTGNDRFEANEEYFKKEWSLPAAEKINPFFMFGVDESDLDEEADNFDTYEEDYILNDDSLFPDEFREWSRDKNDWKSTKTKIQAMLKRKKANSKKNVNQKIPKNLDWRKYGAVAPVQSQGICGSCWTFSTTAAVESANFIKTGKLAKLSEQQLLDCTWYVPHSKDGNHGCMGGWTWKSFAYIKQFGLATSDTYGKYFGIERNCKKDNVTVGISIDSFMKVKSNDAKALKRALAVYGPATASLNTEAKTLKFYSKGIYSDRECTGNTDHSVLIVGYGEERGKLYWIVKNSWGTAWGEDGYVRIENGRCGLLKKPWVVINRHRKPLPWMKDTNYLID